MRRLFWLTKNRKYKKMKNNIICKTQQIISTTLLLILLTQFHSALKSQFSNYTDLRQQLKSGTYNKNLINSFPLATG
jgi:hypothetical protein